jgi:hypothetical protein
VAYKDFTLEKVHKQFGLTLESDQDLFSAHIAPVTLADAFTAYLNYSVPSGPGHQHRKGPLRDDHCPHIGGA